MKSGLLPLTLLALGQGSMAMGCVNKLMQMQKEADG
jgi:hypothetical protein